MSDATIGVLPGDGVGPEVTRQAADVLQAVADRYGHRFDLRTGLVGLAAVTALGVAIDDETFDACAGSDAILFGAVGSLPADRSPAGRRPAGAVRPEHALWRLRKELQLFANLRPVQALESLHDASTIKPECLRGTDLVFVRELSAGLYYGHLESVPGKPSEIRRTPQGAQAVDTLLYTEHEIERVVRVAFELAVGRRGRVTSVDKANVLSSSLLWREVVDRVAPDYPTVVYDHLLVDACAMRLLRAPAEFDVVVTENLFGDILTDEASMLAGSIGMLPSASLGARRTAAGTFGLYEPIHGSAPDIAGQDVANPVGAILSAAMLLRHSLGLADEAAVVERAVEEVLDQGYRTPDLHHDGCTLVGTRALGRLVVDRVAAS